MLFSVFVFFLLVIICEKIKIPEKYIIPYIFGIFAGLPELFLRKSWKIGIATMGFGLLSCSMAFFMAEKKNTFPESEQVKLLMISLGTTVGVGAGLGARSLLGALIGMIAGGTGGWVGYQLWLEYVQFREGNNLLSVFCILFLLFMPIALLTGLGVTVGLRWSKRRASGTSTSS